jgi:hypothetical protein
MRSFTLLLRPRESIRDWSLLGFGEEQGIAHSQTIRPVTRVGPSGSSAPTRLASQLGRSGGERRGSDGRKCSWTTGRRPDDGSMGWRRGRPVAPVRGSRGDQPRRRPAAWVAAKGGRMPLAGMDGGAACWGRMAPPRQGWSGFQGTGDLLRQPRRSESLRVGLGTLAARRYRVLSWAILDRLVR